MPVNSKHPEYTKSLSKWTKCRDAYDGEEAVKAAGTLYLPQLSDQSDEDYQAYKARALFYSATDRTVKALTGAIFSRPYSLNFPEAHKDDLENFGAEGETFAAYAKRTTDEVLAVGRVGLCVDADAVLDDATFSLVQPYASVYYTENIVNWRYTKIDGKQVLTLVVLKEIVTKQIPNSDAFTLEEVEQYRVLQLIDGEYSVQVWESQEASSSKTNPNGGEDTWVMQSNVIPRIKGGKALNFIPFVFASPMGTTGAVEQPPLLGLVNVNLSHYRTSADLEHGRHFTALPTAWATGFDTDMPLVIGSSRAWTTPEPNAKAGFLEFTGAGLGHLAQAIKDKEHQMAVLGARMFDEQKRSAEAAEAMSIRQTGENSVMTNLSISVSEALTQVLRWFAMWAGYQDDTITLRLNTDFGVSLIDAVTLAALGVAVQSKLMSWATYFYNLQRGGMVPENIDEKTEGERIKSGPPVPIPEVPPGGGQSAGTVPPATLIHQKS